MGQLQNYTFSYRTSDNAMLAGGGVMAADDQDAMIQVAKEVRRHADGIPGLPRDHLVSISRPDGSAACPDASVAEFLKK